MSDGWDLPIEKMGKRWSGTTTPGSTGPRQSTRTVNWSAVDQHIRQDSPENLSISAHPVFVVDDTFFRSRTPSTPHWSIAWSDLMMTMFVLFLTLFVYQVAHRDFLSSRKVEVVGGRPLATPLPRSATLPFYPISPEIARNRGKVLRPVEDTRQDRTPAPGRFREAAGGGETPPAAAADASPGYPVRQAAPLPAAGDEKRPAAATLAVTTGEPERTQAVADRPGTDGRELITRIYDLSRTTLASEKMKKFASVELVPDKTMRIILTGDLLFDSGRAELTDAARRSLRKLAAIISHTPYMINVVGHTDSVPMSSPRYPTNWELSTARACQVARYLMEEAGIPGSQIVVSGYSYFRPVRPNTSAANRSANRRVEIILSREPAPAIRTMPLDNGQQAASVPVPAAEEPFPLQEGS